MTIKIEEMLKSRTPCGKYLNGELEVISKDHYVTRYDCGCSIEVKGDKTHTEKCKRGGLGNGQ